jgi:hypothetical protein
MPRKYPYYPVSTPGTGKLAGTEKFVDLCKRRWGFTNLGTFVVRNMRGKKTLSVHSLGVAGDIGYPKTRAGRRKAKEAWDWFIEHSEALGLCELHDYAYRDPKQPKTDQTAYGRGWRCSRGAGSEGIKIFNKTDNAGSFGGAWLHFELEMDMATDAKALEAAWRALPKPQKNTVQQAS